MSTETLVSKEFSEAARFKTSVIAQILMRENPELEHVFKVLNQLHNERSGILRDMVTHKDDNQKLWVLEAQIIDVEYDLDETVSYIKSIINPKSN